MGDAEALTREFLPLYVRVPAARPGMCTICRTGAADPPHETCAGCRRAAHGLYASTEHVVPISLTARDTQLYDVLVRERDPSGAGGRRSRAGFLAATVARFLRAHAACLEERAGGPFTVVATIPDTRAERPIEAFDLMQRVVGQVGALVPRYRPLLLEPVARAAFRVRGRVDDERVLLVDDLFGSGVRVRGAASALYGRGAATVVALVVARFVDINDPHGARIWREAHDRPFGFDRCCLCDPGD
ncbi:hypothetical protein E1286_21565 [Nonomuraea terrae]|uniref:Phosphoribosyltransferase n=1 Tax=Nonomuraea terrae TaxID=2530383 RepID=A0A4R4YMG4_9ACTN|nr:hypothetical protein [Nonomuraea terrae]TDD46166.1 hypothetical protein E1286_21565 [Nonomuraea terrae]